MPAGNVPPNPSELLISEAMINLIEQLKQISDIVILDGPPTQLVTDSLIITRMVDSTVVVTASNQTKKDDLRRIVDNIEKVGGKIAGIVLNKVSISAKKYEQSYYYGSTTSLNESNKKTTAPSMKKASVLENKKATTTDIGNDIIDIKQQETNKNIPEGPTIDKANDILKQINEYIDNEKKDLNS